MPKNYLLDTNICIYLFKGKYNIRKKLKEVGTEHCFVSEITLAELIYGAQCSSNVKKHTKEIEDLVSIIHVLPIRPALQDYGRVKKELRLSGMMIENFDLLIGVTALTNNLVMVTENTKHISHIQGLEIENWVERS